MASDDSGIESHSSPELLGSPDAPVSRTQEYRNVIKPMLERKRRARINKCLDELKDIMVMALQTEGESISKLEKADVLELTVRHLRKLKAQGALILGNSGIHGGESYRAGYSFCVSEISRWVTGGHQGVDLVVSARLLHHLAHTIRTMDSSSMATPVRPLDPRISQLFESRAHGVSVDSRPYMPPAYDGWPAFNSSPYSRPMNPEARLSRKRSDSPVSTAYQRSNSPASSVHQRSAFAGSPDQPRSVSPASEDSLRPERDSPNESAWRPW